MSKNKHLMNLHVKRYVDSVWEKRLREEGFSCPDDKHLCWYRINGEIVNSIIFYSCWSNIPVHLTVGYGIHPLFQKPAYTPSVYYPNRPIVSEILCANALVEDCPIDDMRYICDSDDIMVYVPGRDGQGIYTFEGIILRKMDSVNTIESCYQLHKQWYQDSKHIEAEYIFRNLSAVFVDEAIYVDDSDLYPYCKRRVEDAIRIYQKHCVDKPDRKENATILNEWELRKSVLFDGGRAEYLGVLKKRKEENILYFQNKLGISV